MPIGRQYSMTEVVFAVFSFDACNDFLSLIIFYFGIDLCIIYLIHLVQNLYLFCIFCRKSMKSGEVVRVLN